MIVFRVDRQILTIPMISPIVRILRAISMRQYGGSLGTHDSNIYPQSEAIATTSLNREVVGVHCSNLTRIVPCLVRILVVHIIGYSNLREYTRSQAHVVHTFLSDCFQLIAETIANSCLSQFDCKCRSEISATENAKDVNVPHSVPLHD
jgi:hypothetical protein